MPELEFLELYWLTNFWTHNIKLSTKCVLSTHLAIMTIQQLKTLHSASSSM